VIVDAVRQGAISLEEVCCRYQLTVEEFLGWRRVIETNGVPGLMHVLVATENVFASKRIKAMAVNSNGNGPATPADIRKAEELELEQRSARQFQPRSREHLVRKARIRPSRLSLTVNRGAKL